LKTKYRFLAILAAGLIVVAQEVSLFHVLWHAARSTAAADAGVFASNERSTGDDGQARLCVFDSVIAQVLGCGSCPSFGTGPQIPFKAVLVANAPEQRCVERSSAFLSRAPPALS